MDILQLISSSSFLVLNKNLIKILGLEETVLFSELCSEYDYWTKNNGLENGFFYSTIGNIEEKTTLSAHKQRNAINKLKELNIIEIQIKGVPAKRYIKINEEQVIKIFNIQLLKNLTTSCEKIERK